MRREQSHIAAHGAPPPPWLADAYSELSEPLMRFLAGLAGRGRAEDLASQVWLEATELAGRFEDDVEGFRRLLFTIARRRLIDHRRRWWQRRVVLRGDDGAWADHPDPGLAVDQTHAFELVGRLPHAQAEVVLLRVIAGFSAEQVGEITGRSPAPSA